LAFKIVTQHIQIEGLIFQVDIGRLEQISVTFKEIFSLPSGGGPVEGSENDPVVLTGISADDFGNFLYWHCNGYVVFQMLT